VSASDLVTLANPRSAAAEAYRTLRTNIQLSSIDSPVRALLVTSASADEGKSTTLANLAVAFAQAGQRVVIVDSDLRRPSLHTIFGVANERGLTTMLLEDDAPAPLVETSVPGLRLLASGPIPPNPSELLGSKRVEQAIERLRADADLLLFDAPPVLAVSDAAVLSRRVDAAMLIVSAGRTGRAPARGRAHERDRRRGGLLVLR
jgi:capsular exopolysaccharide synthesis family protein